MSGLDPDRSLSGLAASSVRGPGGSLPTISSFEVSGQRTVCHTGTGYFTLLQF